jgi:FkbM family methyltransferase
MADVGWHDPPMPIPTRITALAERVLPERAMQAARVGYFDLRRRRYPRRIVERTYGGRPYKVLIASDYGERYDRDWPELPEIAWLREGRLRAGARVFDLGASYGVVAMMLADEVGEGGAVLALEADPDDAATMARNRELNAKPQLECVHAAVARVSGTIEFGRNGSVDDGRGRWGRTSVPSFAIDDLTARHGVPDVVFIDVEGYELEALRGAPDTLAAGPEWFVEIHEPAALARYGATTEDVLSVLTDAGYDVWTLADAGYFVDDAGIVRPVAAPAPLAATPRQLLRERFFALASRERSTDVRPGAPSAPQ